MRHGGGLSADAEIERVIRTNDLQRQRGAEFDPLDSHADLVRFKLAGCLAVLAGRTHITVDDWSLAGTIWRTGRLIRTVVKEQIAIEGRKVEASRTAAAVRREEAISTSAADQAIKAMAKNIATAVRRHAQSSCPDGCSKRCAHASTASKHRQLATIDEALEHAARAELVAWRGERLLPGKVVPA